MTLWAAALVAGVLLGVAFPQIRRLVAIAVAAGAAVLVIMLLLGEIEDRKAVERVSASELEFEDEQLIPDYSSFKFKARVTNHSQDFEVRRLTLMVTAEDCAWPAADDCTLIGQAERTAYVVIAPESSARVSQTIYFGSGPLDIQGRLSWQYEVVEIHAALPDVPLDHRPGRY